MVLIIASEPTAVYTFPPGPASKDLPPTLQAAEGPLEVSIAVTRTTRASAAREALLEEFKAVAEKLGLKIREERLLREVGYRVRSGSCRVGEDEIVFLERGLPTSTQLDVLVEVLAGRALDEVYLSPAARALLERAVTKSGLDNGGSEAHSG
jgi:hypothetical protein